MNKSTTDAKNGRQVVNVRPVEIVRPELYTYEFAGRRPSWFARSQERPKLSNRHAQRWYEALREVTSWIEADTRRHGGMPRVSERRDDGLRIRWCYVLTAIDRTFYLSKSAAVFVAMAWANAALDQAENGYEKQPSRCAMLGAELDRQVDQGFAEEIRWDDLT